jgi:threonine dehydrogenase-like Zn-dependent dehydrogenase
VRSMVFVRPGRLEWADLPDARLRGPLEGLVRPRVMGRCDLDVAYLRGRLPLASGEPIGHEIIGEIVELGEDAAKSFRIGQRVIVPAQINCGDCSMCRRGETGRCQSVPLGASYGMGRAGGFGGAVSECVRVPFAAAMLIPIPEQTDPAPLMGLTDMATDAWRAVGPPLAARPGASVLVMGGGARVIGIYAAALAACLGAGRVVYVDADGTRREVAARYSVQVAQHIDGVESASFDIVVDASGETDRLAEGIRACGPSAYLTCVAPPPQWPELSTREAYYKGLTFHIGRPNCRAGHTPALEAWASRGFQPQLVGPKVFPFEEAIDAWLDPALYVAVHRH